MPTVIRAHPQPLVWPPYQNIFGAPPGIDERTATGVVFEAAHFTVAVQGGGRKGLWACVPGSNGTGADPRCPRWWRRWVAARAFSP